MFWTCDEQCQHNKREFQKRQKAFNIINREYLNGVAQVCCTTCVVGSSPPSDIIHQEGDKDMQTVFMEYTEKSY